jgi:hypothetical protein
MQTNDEQTLTGPVEAIVTLQSAEWYAMRFEELRAWLGEQEKKSEEKERQCEEAGLQWAAGKAQGQGDIAFRAQRWLDHFVSRSK